MTIKVAVPCILVLIAGAFLSTQGAHANGVRSCTVDDDQVIVTLEAGAYQITESRGGHRIDIEGFGDLMVPGGPMLPMKRFLIALPPGARALSVEILGDRAAEVPGTFAIAPMPGIKLLQGMPRWDEAMQRIEEERDRDRKSVV